MPSGVTQGSARTTSNWIGAGANGSLEKSGTQLMGQPSGRQASPLIVGWPARKNHRSRQSRSFVFAGQPSLVARHEPAHCIVVDDQLPEPDPIPSVLTTVATWPKRWNAKATIPRRLIWPEASISVSPAELTRP